MSEAVFRRQAGPKRVSETTRRRRNDVEKLAKTLQKVARRRTRPHSMKSRQEVMPDVAKMPEPRHEIQGRILFSGGGRRGGGKLFLPETCKSGEKIGG